jgi:hypothetical protein
MERYICEKCRVEGVKGSHFRGKCPNCGAPVYGGGALGRGAPAPSPPEMRAPGTGEAALWSPTNREEQFRAEEERRAARDRTRIHLDPGKE